jgi:hypothetical protein
VYRDEDVGKSGGELAIFDGATFAFDDNVIIVKFGIRIKDVDGGRAIFDIVCDETIVVNVVEGLSSNRYFVAGVSGELFGVIGCGRHFLRRLIEIKGFVGN